MTDQPIHVVIADDHAIVREGLSAILAGEAAIVVVGEASNGAEAVEVVQATAPDVVLLDLVMPIMDGLLALKHIKQACPHVHIVILTSFADDERVFAAIKAGAMGYLLKDSLRVQLVEAIQCAAQGQAYLHPLIARKVMGELVGGKGEEGEQNVSAPSTPLDLLTEREVETLRLLARGMTNQDIAAALHIHERTVAKYVSHILEKLHLVNRTQAALYALRHGLEQLYDG
jgi:NarL family two-component system response regulator LiaR